MFYFNSKRLHLHEFSGNPGIFISYSYEIDTGYQVSDVYSDLIRSTADYFEGLPVTGKTGYSD